MQLAATVVIPSFSGGWIEIGHSSRAAQEFWYRKHNFDPRRDLGRAIEDDDLVSNVAVHALHRSYVCPIVWPYETQREFVFFLAFIARMTFRFPQHARFADPAGRLAIDAEAYVRSSEPPHRRVHVRFDARVASPIRDTVFETNLDFHQAALGSIVRSCCAVFPALGPDDYEAAWN